MSGMYLLDTITHYTPPGCGELMLHRGMTCRPECTKKLRTEIRSFLYAPAVGLTTSLRSSVLTHSKTRVSSSTVIKRTCVGSQTTPRSKKLEPVRAPIFSLLPVHELTRTLNDASQTYSPVNEV